MAKKFMRFAEVCAYGVGTIGGLGVSLANRAIVIAVCVAALSAMAFPEAKKAFKELTESE